MWTDAHLDRSAFPAQARVRDRARARGRPARRALVGLTAVALLASAAIATAPAAFVEPDLARVIRFMALIKGGFALANEVKLLVNLELARA